MLRIASDCWNGRAFASQSKKMRQIWLHLACGNNPRSHMLSNRMYSTSSKTAVPSKETYTAQPKRA
eukprot:2479243-Karenia_brevis.AAC.1